MRAFGAEPSDGAVDLIGDNGYYRRMVMMYWTRSFFPKAVDMERTA